MEKHENIDLRGTIALVFIFLAWFAFLWLLNMGMTLQIWPVK